MLGPDFDEYQQASAEQATVRIGLGFSLSALGLPANWIGLEMLSDALTRAAGPDTPTMRALALVTAPELEDRLLGELAYSACCGLAVIDAGQT